MIGHHINVRNPMPFEKWLPLHHRAQDSKPDERHDEALMRPFVKFSLEVSKFVARTARLLRGLVFNESVENNPFRLAESVK